jgi:hypothetical protein
MTCRRLEDRDALAELVEDPDRHTQHCPDCSARVRGYQRIASWIAEGRTNHRAPADWRRRTLAQLRAAASDAASAPSALPQPGPRAPSPLAGATRSDPTRARRLPPSAPPRKARLLAAFAIASAAIIVVTLVALMTRGDESAVRIAIGTEPKRVAPSNEPSAKPRLAPSTDRSQTESPPSSPVANEPAHPPHPIGRAQGSSTTDGPGPDDSPGQLRGARVTIDIPSAEPLSPVPPTIDVSIDTTPPGARVLLDGVILGTTPYRGTLPRSGLQLKLAIWLADFLDEVITVDASQSITRHIQLVPIQHGR